MKREMKTSFYTRELYERLNADNKDYFAPYGDGTGRGFTKTVIANEEYVTVTLWDQGMYCESEFYWIDAKGKEYSFKSNLSSGYEETLIEKIQKTRMGDTHERVRCHFCHGTGADYRLGLLSTWSHYRPRICHRCKGKGYRIVERDFSFLQFQINTTEV